MVADDVIHVCGLSRRLSISVLSQYMPWMHTLPYLHAWQSGLWQKNVGTYADVQRQA